MTAPPYLSLLLADGRLPTGRPHPVGRRRAGAAPRHARRRGARRTCGCGCHRHRGRGGRGRGRGAGLAARRRQARVVDALAEVDAAWRVRTLSDALREASDLLGRSYLRTAAAVWDLAPFATAPGPWCRAVVLGVVAAEAGLDAEQTARLVAYEDVQTVVAAALKLEPFDPSARRALGGRRGRRGRGPA